MRDLKWIFFDLGWTLFDETPSHRDRLRGLMGVLGRFGCRMDVDELLQLCEKAATGFWPSPFLGMLTNLGLTGDQLAAARSAARYDHSHEVFYPGVPGLLCELSERYMLGVIANQSEGTEQRLESRGIRNLFSVVLASAELGLSKPDPRIFSAALERAGCRPEEALMVGDRIDNDIAPAKAQVWQTVRVLQGFSRFQKPRGPSEMPDVTIDEIRELGSALSSSRLVG